MEQKQPWIARLLIFETWLEVYLEVINLSCRTLDRAFTVERGGENAIERYRAVLSAKGMFRAYYSSLVDHNEGGNDGTNSR
jgi:hypothetical protein